MQKIKLTKGKFAIVDDRDFSYLSQWKWYAGEGQGGCYAQRSSVNKNTKSGRSIILMHRVILCAGKGEYIDHQNHNTLDNTRQNLSKGSSRDNQRNQKLFSSNTTGFQGLWYDKNRKRWRATIGVNNKDVFIGRYKDKEDAIKARKEAEIKYGFHKNHGM